MGTRDEKIRREEKKAQKSPNSKKAGRPDLRQDTEQVLSHNPLSGKPKTK